MPNLSRMLRPAVLPLILALAGTAHADVLAHWSFDELTGPDHDTFVDSGGNPVKHNALVGDKGQISINVASDVPFGKAATFTGKTGSYLDLPAIAGIYDHSFTIAAWVYLTKADHNYVLADWSPPMSMSYAFGFDTPKGNTTTSRISAWMKSDVVKTNSKTKQRYNVDVIKFNPATTISLNTWHHVAWVWDRQDNTTATLTIYLDAVKADTVGLYKGSTATLLNNHRGPKIGLKQDVETSFHGSMDELWMFDDALTATQVTNLMKTNDISGAAVFAAVTPAPAPADATVATPASPVAVAPAAPSASAVAAAPATPSPAAPADVKPGDAAAYPPAAGDATPAAPSPTPATPQTPIFSTAAPASAPTVAVAPTPAPAAAPKPTVSEAKPDFMSAARAAAAAPMPTAVNTVAVTPRHYTPERMLGLVGTGALALTLSSFLVWATMERGKMQRPRGR